MTKQHTFDCSDFILRALESMGVSTFFGVPGGAIEPLFNALSRHELESRGRLVLARSESGAAFMAQGFQIESNTLGVALTTSGPGATNLVTAVAASFAEQIPLLVITAQPAVSKLGKLCLQDSSDASLDVVAMLKPITKYSSLVSHADQLPSKLKAALIAAMETPRGPVHLSVPADVLETAIAARPDPAWFQRAAAVRPGHAPASHIAQARTLLLTARNPVIMIGERAAGAQAAVTALIDSIGIPVVATSPGNSWLPWSHPRFQGVIGFGGHDCADTVVREADLVLAIGVGFSELGTHKWDQELFGEKLLILDDQRTSAMHWHGNSLTVVGDIHATVLALVSSRSPAAREPAAFRAPPASSLKALDGSQLVQALEQLAPAHTRAYIDAGNSWAWALHYMPVSVRMARVRLEMGWGCMAWAIGAAVGAKFGAPTAPIMCVTGDGAWLMSSQELSTAVAEKLPIIFVILNDAGLGMVRHGQRLGGAAQIAHDFPNANFSLIAQAMGATGYRVSTLAELRKIPFDELVASEVPTVIEVMVDPEAVPPMGRRVQTLGS